MLIYGIYIFYYAANDVKLLMDGRTIFCAIFFLFVQKNDVSTEKNERK